MRVLTLNCGSSTLKFDVIEVRREVKRIAGGSIDRIGHDASATLEVEGKHLERKVEAGDYAGAFGRAVDLLDEVGCLSQIEAVGHRVVHGGPHFQRTVLVDDTVIEGIQGVSELAPLHNDNALAVLLAARPRFHGLPMAAAFDTAFFANLPAAAAGYALPVELAQRLQIRRYGFHGLAHGYMIERYQRLRPGVAGRLITLQLGNGCSVSASLDGRPIDTSMGLTPLEGLIMGTRSGDLDPALPLYLQTHGAMSPEEVESLLNTRSGLLGLSGSSSDMRDLLAAEKRGDARAALAVEAFCLRARKYIGAYMALLGGADAVIFGGGIGENSAEIRRRICEGFEWAGLELNAARNEQTKAVDAPVSAGGSGPEVWVVHVDEALTIATETAALVEAQP